MEAKPADVLPNGPGWQFEPKWDGFRCLAFKGDCNVELRAKSGKSLSRYFPEMISVLEKTPADNFVLDGELAIPIGGSLSFGALQDRRHSAESRVRKLAVETPALLILFDCLFTKATGPLLSAPLTKWRSILDKLSREFGRAYRTRLSPITTDRDEAQRWLQVTHGALDGVVAKKLDAQYAPGKREMVKVKRLRSADCVVGGFRYARRTRLVGSLLLGLFNEEGQLDHVGFTSAISDAERAPLTRALEALVGGQASPATRLAAQAVGQLPSPQRGRSSNRSSSLKSATTTLPPAAFGMAQPCCVGARIRRRANALAIRSKRRLRRVSWSKSCFDAYWSAFQSRKMSHGLQPPRQSDNICCPAFRNLPRWRAHMETWLLSPGMRRGQRELMVARLQAQANPAAVAVGWAEQQ